MSRGGPVVAFLAATVLVALVGTTAAPVGSVHAQAGANPTTQPAAFAAIGQIDADAVQLDVTLRPDGDADWEIRYRVLLDDDNTTAAFESLARDVDENRSAYVRRFADRITRTVAAAENATGRRMSAEDVSVRTTRQEIPQRYGLLIYSFTWTNFAATDGPRMHAGDAIAGLFLDDSTSITIRFPSGYGVVSTDPRPDESGDRSVTWRGPTEFTTEQPRLVVSAEVTSGASPGPGDGDGEQGGGPSTAAIAVAGLAVLVALAVTGTWMYRRKPSETGPGSPSTVEAEPPEELLSNEERVLRLLREQGGRMKQQQVVESLGWTDAKTSQVVGSLRDSGDVEGFRLGRENVLRIPEEDERSEE